MHGAFDVDRLRLAYLALTCAQLGLVALYELHLLPPELALAGGLATALCGPSLSLRISLHVFRTPHRSRRRDLGTVALSYVVTCLSFAIVYIFIAERDPHAFSLAAGAGASMSLGAGMYFSIITITTTGYGDIAPVSDLARAAVCWEVATGLLYQIFVFSLVASLISKPPASEFRSEPKPR